MKETKVWGGKWSKNKFNISTPKHNSHFVKTIWLDKQKVFLNSCWFNGSWKLFGLKYFFFWINANDLLHLCPNDDCMSTMYTANSILARTILENTPKIVTSTRFDVCDIQSTLHHLLLNQLEVKCATQTIVSDHSFWI